jgi:hypothetical protein
MQMQRILSMLAIAASIAVPGCASIIDVNLISPALAGLPGDTLTFQGTLANSPGADQYINGAQLALNGFNSSSLNSSAFLFNAPIILPNGATTTAFTFFSVAIPPTFTSGPYAGAFTVTGGATSSAQDPLGSALFTVQVGSPVVSGVPEPASCTLLVIGGAWLIGRKRNGQNAPNREQLVYRLSHN